VEGETSPLLLMSRHPIETRGCAATSRPDFRAGMAAYTYDHNSPELLHTNGIIMERGEVSFCYVETSRCRAEVWKYILKCGCD
jgi:hypothetical protein